MTDKCSVLDEIHFVALGLARFRSHRSQPDSKRLLRISRDRFDVPRQEAVDPALRMTSGDGFEDGHETGQRLDVADLCGFDV